MVYVYQAREMLFSKRNKILGAASSASEVLEIAAFEDPALRTPNINSPCVPATIQNQMAVPFLARGNSIPIT